MHILQTGQKCCYDATGREISCLRSGQDGEYQKGIPWPAPRFKADGRVVLDMLTGLFWSRDANIGGFPGNWFEAFTYIAAMNKEKFAGFSDWRLPCRRELHSLMAYQARKPSLPDGHPFENVFLGWYWSSTTAAIQPAYAWYVHLEGARMFYGKKDQYCLFWPVRGRGNGVLAATGQDRCFAVHGQEISCTGTGQDGELEMGSAWPDTRFIVDGKSVEDTLTGLVWGVHADATHGPVSWQGALDAVRFLNSEKYGSRSDWRLPNINELESLVDCRQHTPALSAGHPFFGLQDGYWSSTTSYFETDWSWVLYLNKGACGVGHKPGRTFFVWPVATV